MQKTSTPDGSTPRRQDHDDSKALNLPRLPVRAQHERRPRLPPTLSGLYEPPPSAGLLPSISVERPDIAKVPSSATAADERLKAKVSRNKWTDLETKCLLQGVARFGIGNWTKILRCPDYNFGKRTALDLKDRFRVCCPDQYGSTGRPAKEPGPRSTVINLVDLGLQAPFTKSSRRKRHAYTDIEDQHLLKGFQKYGKSWSSIQQDATLCLGHRTRTDLRDRMRTKYPQHLKLAEDTSSNKVQSPAKLNQAAPTDHTSWLGSDPYLSIAFDETDFDTPITLDRGILDWPNTSAGGKPPDAGRSGVSALPSLATITAPNGQQINEDHEMLELPALSQFFVPPLDMEDRAGANAFLSLDELLS